ncbi:hypothetical protein FRC09_006962 [Ceratobasidium sp. 395]|nr:hypothetical protein FRC09_006962 [Ceratobasidium sp. 395]
MPPKSTKRDRLRGFFKHPSHALGQVLHLQSPASSVQGVDQTRTVKPAPMPTNHVISTDEPGLFVLKNSFTALRNIAMTIPPIAPIVDPLAEFIEAISATAQNREDLEELARNIAISTRALVEHQNKLNPAHMTDSIDNLVSELTRQAEYISKKQERSSTMRYMDAERDADELVNCYRRIDALFRQLQSDAILSVWRIANENLAVASEALVTANDDYTNIRLEGMHPVKEARYDSETTQVRRVGCTPNTRVAVLKGLVEWANDINGPRAYWMNGMAGTGKTTIAWSFCDILNNTNQLAASFFCSRLLPGCRDATRIVPTLTYQLARLCRPYQDALRQVLDNDPDICYAGITKQFKKLIVEPINKTNQSIPPGRLLFVIDALDECSNRLQVQSLLSEFSLCAADFPIKLFVTCRPEPGLFDRFLSFGQSNLTVFQLHDIEESLVQADIETYLCSELKASGVSGQQINLLVKRAGKLFIYATTVVRYIRPSAARVNPQNRLHQILNSETTSSNKVYEPLDLLYGAVISSALENTELESWEAENVKLVLHTVLCVQEPMSVGDLACLLGLSDKTEAQLAIESLGSVLHLSDGQKLVTTLHASFSDYMHNRDRSGRFWCDFDGHEFLARRCLDIMKNLLRFNICSLASSFIRDVDIPDLPSQIRKAIPSYLFYVCRYWSSHTGRATNSALLLSTLNDFLINRVLFWVEVMNLKKCIGLCSSMLFDVYNWMKTFHVADSTLAICLDAQKFVTVFAGNSVRSSTPHIYASVLALWDRDGAMWAHYGAKLNSGVGMKGLAINNRKSKSLAVWGTGGEVTCAAVSPDGMRVLSGSKQHELYLWDTYTGALIVGPFGGHTDRINSVAFSPDGNQVASCSQDCGIQLWDVRTGEPVGPSFQGHQSPVLSVMFSPKGIHVVSGSADCTVRIWSTATGQTVVGPFQGHTDWVRSIAFSSDGERLVSGSYDHTIRIWDVQTGRTIIGPIEGHTDGLYAVAFSSDGSRIVSGSWDATLRVWDSQSGREISVIGNGHTEPVTCVAFNPDGSRVLSGSRDCTARLWDADSGEAIVDQYTKHNKASVLLATYLPDGHHIVSISTDGILHIWDARTKQAPMSALAEQIDSPLSSIYFPEGSSQILSVYKNGIICGWDTHTGDTLGNPFRSHNKSISAAAFSPDGSRVAIGSNVSDISIWDVQTGRAVIESLEGHRGIINSVAFSADGRRIVSASSLGSTVRVWDVKAGHALGDPLVGHTDPVYSVAYSPDNNRIASGSDDGAINIWDAQTGQATAWPLKGHRMPVLSLAFSSDSTRIISGSEDGTIRVWDAQYGLAMGEPFRGHTDAVTSVAYSPDGSCILSSSRDCTVRIWDAKTGSVLAGPFRAHTESITSVAYSPDGELFASGSSDGAIRVWRLQVSLPGGIDPVDDWTVNQDGWVIAQDSSLLLWVPEDLRTALKWPQNVAVLHSRGSIDFQFEGAAIGSNWKNIYVC